MKILRTEMTEKYCTKCRKLLPITDFYMKKVGKHRYRETQCKFCSNEYSKRYYQEHREHLLELRRKWREEHQERQGEGKKKNS